MSERKQVVLVTGASRGIGLAVAAALLETFNAIVVAIQRTRTPELLDLLRKHPSTLLLIDADVADEIAVREAIGLTVKTYQHLDALVLNAAVLEPLGKIGSSSIKADDWRNHFNINFFSLIYSIQAALPDLQKSEFGGRIIFVSSGSAVGGLPGWGPYNASKAAMNSLCRTIAQEEPNVVSVALRPGMVDTQMQVTLREKGPEHIPAKDMQRFINAYTEGKLVKPEDSGHVIAALALKAPKSMSGQFVSWDGEECKDFRRQ